MAGNAIRQALPMGLFFVQLGELLQRERNSGKLRVWDGENLAVIRAHRLFFSRRLKNCFEKFLVLVTTRVEACFGHHQHRHARGSAMTPNRVMARSGLIVWRSSMISSSWRSSSRRRQELYSTLPMQCAGRVAVDLCREPAHVE